MIYSILLFTILFFILAWRRLDLAVMFLIAALPVYLIRFNIFGLPATILEVMIWVVFLVWLVKNFSQVKNNFLENFKKENKKTKIRYPFDWEMVLLLLVALLAVAVAGFNSSALGIWKAYFFEPVLLFIVVINLMAQKPPLIPPLQGGQKFPPPPFPPERPKSFSRAGIKGVELVLWPLVISALVVSVLAIYQKFTGQFIDNPVWAAEAARRVVSFFGYPNAVGLYLGPIILVMTGWLLNVILERSDSGAIGSQGDSIGRRWRSFLQNDKLRIVFISLTIMASVLSIYFAKSKGALLGVAAGLVVFGLLAGKKIRWATVAVGLIMAAGLLSYQPARDLAVRNITLTNLSGQIRIAGWSDTWRMLKDGHLITGVGIANYQAVIAPYHTQGIFIKDYSDPDFQRKLVFNKSYRTAHWQPLEIYLYPHNILLNFWSELGLAGLLLFIWIMGKYFWLGISHAVIAASEPQSRNVASARTWIPGQARDDRYIVIGLICAMVVIIVHGLVDVPYFKNDLAVMFWLLVAMMSLINLHLPPLTKASSCLRPELRPRGALGSTELTEVSRTGDRGFKV